MAAAHAKFIEQSCGWVISSELNEKGAIIIITVDEPATKTRLKALGFCGFMSLDSHHQAHHYQMAMGKSH
jgi:enoyl-[acyl-carrier-protein] reductase (NADH)